MSLWKESIEDAFGELVLNLPIVFFFWLGAMCAAMHLCGGNRITVALLVLTGIAVFLVIFGVVFWIETLRNLRIFVLKENPEYAKNRLKFREFLKRQIVFGERES